MTLTYLKKALPTLSFLFLLLPITKLWAAKYCLTQPTPALKASLERKLAPFLKRSEAIIWEGACFEIALSDGRDMLIQKLIGEVAPFNVASEVVVTRTPCELELIEESKGNSQRDKVGVGSNVQIGKSHSDFSGLTSSRLLLSSGRPGKIEAYESRLEVVCTLVAHGAQAEVELWLVGDSGRAQISHTIMLSKGHRQFLGDVVQTLRENNKSFSLGTGARLAQTKTHRKTEFYLLLK